MAETKQKMPESKPPTAIVMSGRCSFCSNGYRSMSILIVRIEHEDAPRVPAVGLEGHPNGCQCKPCLRLAAKNGTVPQWFGFCRRCAAIIGAIEFPPHGDPP